jgi:hypothetical protein
VPEALLCPCGAPAPTDLPPPGSRPRPCPRCATPLVAPGSPGAAALQRAAGAGLLVAAAAAAGWAALSRAAGARAADLPFEPGFGAKVALSLLLHPAWAIPAGAAAVALMTQAAAGARSTATRWIAMGAFVVFLAVGEWLLYRNVLLHRLVAMHAVEGAQSPEILGAEEHHAMTPWKYKDLETDLGWFLAVAAGVLVVWRLARPHAGVVVFRCAEEPAPEDTPADAAPAPVI